jgi:hypothetical protein
MPEVQSRTYANPRRLPRRNHYQEGPDFLFVATQGGRPPDPAFAPGVAAIVRRRRAALRRWAAGEPIARICAEAGCSRASLFRWRARFDHAGLVGLLDRPHLGRRSDLPPPLERLILTVRLLTYWNSQRIAAEFRRRSVWPLTHGQVDRVLARHGTHRPSYVRTPGPRYERAAANELWHIDLKGPFFFAGATGQARTCHFVALVAPPECAEGTPSFYSASSTFLDVGFHYFDRCEVDRPARGSTDWTTWTAAPRPAYEAAFRRFGLQGGVGDRDTFRFRGFDFTVQEGQAVWEQFETFRIYLYDDAAGTAERLDLRTPAGCVAFTNPMVELLDLGGRPAIVATAFVPGEAGSACEVGPMLWAHILDG